MYPVVPVKFKLVLNQPTLTKPIYLVEESGSDYYLLKYLDYYPVNTNYVFPITYPNSIKIQPSHFYYYVRYFSLFKRLCHVVRNIITSDKSGRYPALIGKFNTNIGRPSKANIQINKKYSYTFLKVPMQNPLTMFHSIQFSQTRN